jgi:diacylglycerol kinase (ATP)
MATLRAAGWIIDLKETGGLGDATRFAQEAAAAALDAVVVAGGDGTVNEVVQGLAGQRQTALAVLPGGTVNVWATELGADEHAADLAERIAVGRRRTVDLGRVNNRYILVMANVGFDASASATVASSGPLGRLRGHFTTVASALPR